MKIPEFNIRRLFTFAVIFLMETLELLTPNVDAIAASSLTFPLIASSFVTPEIPSVCLMSVTLSVGIAVAVKADVVVGTSVAGRAVVSCLPVGVVALAGAAVVFNVLPSGVVEDVSLVVV